MSHGHPDCREAEQETVSPGGGHVADPSTSGLRSQATSAPVVGEPRPTPLSSPEKQRCLALPRLLFLHQSLCTMTLMPLMITKEENAHSGAGYFRR